MWSFAHSVESREVTRRQVWAVWADLPNWPTWDTAAAWVRPDATGPTATPMAVGQTYVLQPRRGPKARGTITEATPGRSFADVTRLPLCSLAFDHTVVDLPAGGGVRVTHRVSLSGPLTFLFRPLLGRRIAAGIPAVMDNLIRRAAKTEPAAGVG